MIAGYATCAICFADPPDAAAAATVTEIHAFGEHPDGDAPYMHLLSAGGVIYGTTRYGGTYPSGCKAGCGTIYRLTPRAGAPAAETILYDFSPGPSGQIPLGDLAIDRAGALYGVTQDGGLYTPNCISGQLVGCGVLYKLAPPASPGAQWNFSTLFQFASGQTVGGLYRPAAGPTYYKPGVLVGEGTGGNGAGLIYNLYGPDRRGIWHQGLVYAFLGGADGSLPAYGFLPGPDGTLFGVTTQGGISGAACSAGCGTIFQMHPPAAGKPGWTKTILHSFLGGAEGSQPATSLVQDASGRICGATASGGTANQGTVFQLVPPASGQSAWSLQTLYSLDSPVYSPPHITSVVAAPGGTLFVGLSSGIDQQDADAGAILRISPPANGQTAWTTKDVHDFPEGFASPYLTQPVHPGVVPGITASGGPTTDGVISTRGTVFELHP